MLKDESLLSAVSPIANSSVDRKINCYSTDLLFGSGLHNLGANTNQMPLKKSPQSEGIGRTTSPQWIGNRAREKKGLFFGFSTATTVQ